MSRSVVRAWSYDPRQDGALCDQCSLQGKTPVPSELRHNSALQIVAEAPGKQEEILGFPLVGPSGQETEAALAEAGLSREDTSMLNVMCCRAGEINYDAHLRTVNARNRGRKKRGLSALLPPHEACLPRLIRELDGAAGLFLMGKYARRALLGISRAEPTDDGEEDARIPGRGFPGVASIKGRRVPCLSSVHPAFVLRSRRWTKIFRSDVRKAARMVRGELSWIEPAMLFFPSATQFCDFMDEIERGKETISYDVETDGKRPTECSLRCVGIGTKSTTTCVPFKTVESYPRWHYSPVDLQQIIDRFMQFFRNVHGIVAPQNGKFDHAVMESCGWFPDFEIKRKVFDTVIAHHVAWSEWPHDLDFLIAQYTDAPHHKGKDHDKWTSDRDLHKYCMLDVARTAECAEKLAREPALRAQKIAFKTDTFLSTFCRELGNIGMALDVKERDRLYVVQTGKMDTERARARQLGAEALAQADRSTAGTRELAGELNPGSFQQVGRLIYEALGVDPAPEKAGGYTQSGGLSTKADTLYYLMDRGMPDVVERLLLAVIDYRGAAKLRGTYCTVQPCCDGRVRPSWNPHVVVSGRLSCSEPNLLNLERSIRSMYVAAPGHSLLSCDKKQQELRATAWLAQDMRWIDALLADADLHRINAVDLLGIASVDQVTPGQRQFTKTFVFAIQYLAGLKKAYQMIRNFVEPKIGKRPYRTRTMSEIAACYRRFWNAHKAISRFHEKNREFWASSGYLADVLHQRRRYFLDGGGDESIKEEQANFLIQTVSASDVNDATRRVREKYPIGFAGANTGIVHYAYDALTLEVPTDRAVEIGADITQIMGSKIGDMPFPVDLAIGKNYGNEIGYTKNATGEWIVG